MIDPPRPEAIEGGREVGRGRPASVPVMDQRATIRRRLVAIRERIGIYREGGSARITGHRLGPEMDDETLYREVEIWARLRPGWPPEHRGVRIVPRMASRTARSWR